VKIVKNPCALTTFSKISVVVTLNKPLRKLPKIPLHLAYVLALPWEIHSVRLSRQHNN